MPCIAKNHSKNYSFQSCKPRFTPLPIPTVLIKQIHQLINNFPEAVVVLSLGDLFAYLFVSLCLLWQTNMFFLNQRTWNGKNSQSGSRWRVWVFQKGFAFISERCFARERILGWQVFPFCALKVGPLLVYSHCFQWEIWSQLHLYPSVRNTSFFPWLLLRFFFHYYWFWSI